MAGTTTIRQDATMTSERNRAVVQAVRDGESYRSIGRRFGISAARVGQIVAREDPDASEVGAEVRERQRAQENPQPQTYTRTCPVCRRTFQTTDSRRTTDTGILPTPKGQEDTCANLWHKRDWQFSQDAYLRRQGATARMVLRKVRERGEGAYPEVRVRWATKFLEEHPEFREDPDEELGAARRAS